MLHCHLSWFSSSTSEHFALWLIHKSFKPLPSVLRNPHLKVCCGTCNHSPAASRTRCCSSSRSAQAASPCSLTTDQIFMFSVSPFLPWELACAAGWLLETHPSYPLLAARCPLQSVYCFHFGFHNSLEILIKIPRLLLLKKKKVIILKEGGEAKRTDLS